MASLPASWGALLAGLLAFGPSAHAQAAARVGTIIADGVWFHDEPGGKRLARLERGAEVRVGATEGDWQAIVLEGHIWNRSIGRAAAEGFDLRVTVRSEENLREAPNGTVIARLLEGFLLERLEAGDRWTRVRRSGWVRRAQVRAAEAEPSEVDGSSADEVARAPAGAVLLARPGGDTTATFLDSSRVRVLDRRDGWVRVRVDGWLREGELAATDGAPTGVTAADLRSDPERYRGRIVRWPLEFIGVRRADELRPDMPLGHPYLLTRGPLPEGEFVYVMLPEERLPEAASLVPLSTVVVTARIREPRARFLGNPVLELVDFHAGRDR